MSVAHLEIRTVDLFIESSSTHGRLAKSAVNKNIASDRYRIKKLPLGKFRRSGSSRQG